MPKNPFIVISPGQDPPGHEYEVEDAAVLAAAVRFEAGEVHPGDERIWKNAARLSAADLNLLRAEGGELYKLVVDSDALEPEDLDEINTHLADQTIEPNGLILALLMLSAIDDARRFPAAQGNLVGSPEAYSGIADAVAAYRMLLQTDRLTDKRRAQEREAEAAVQAAAVQAGATQAAMAQAAMSSLSQHDIAYAFDESTWTRGDGATLDCWHPSACDQGPSPAWG